MIKVRFGLFFTALMAILAFSVVPSHVSYAAAPVIGPCQVFPSDSPWNADISNAAVHPDSLKIVKAINNFGGDNVHPDFGDNQDYGIPWTTVDNSQALVPIQFDYDDESDPGPYPIPPNAPIEGGGDKHVLVVNTDTCILYEMYNSRPQGNPVTSWKAGSGAVFDLSSNDLRPDGWTSADAAGLPILPGLARCDEAESGVIDHALRVTFSRTQRSYQYPATHFASGYTRAQYPYYPPMGMRFRLKPNYNLSQFEGQALAIAQALKKYGMIVADNGSNWYISGERDRDECWDNDVLNALKGIPGTAFEVILSPPPPSADGELIINGGFEATKADRVPMKWVIVKGTKEKRLCDRRSATNPGSDIVYSFEGQCAFAFYNSQNENSILKQNVSIADVDTIVTVAAQVKSQALADGVAKIQLKVKYDDDTLETFPIGLPSDTGGNYELVTQDVTFAKPLKTLTVQVSFKGKTGKMWVDNVSMTNAAPPLLVPVPGGVAGRQTN